MLPFVLRRILQGVPLLIAASFLSFVLVANAGDPLEEMKMNPRISQEQIDAKAHELKLDRPVITRYLSWAGGAIHGDFGEDLDGNPVWPQLFRALKVTLRLVVVAITFAVLIALVVGVISAIRQYTLFDYGATTVSFLCFALPTFWLAVLLKEFLAIPLNDRLEDLGFSRWISTIGDRTPNFSGSFMAQVGDTAGHIALPALTLVLISFAQYSRFTRSSMLDVMSSDFVRTARAKGLSARRTVLRHGLRNALIPVTTVVALDFASVLGGAIITERVFQWQGMGTLLITAISDRDVYVMQSWLLVTAAAVILANIAADVLYAVLDPRIRLD